MLATSEIRPLEFRDAANKSEYRLIWLSTSQFLPSRPPPRDGPIPSCPSCPREKSLSMVGGYQAKFVSLVRALAF